MSNEHHKKKNNLANLDILRRNTVGAQSIARRHSTYVITPKKPKFEKFCLERLRRRSLQGGSLKETVYFRV